jgi:hypothetical protein
VAIVIELQMQAFIVTFFRPFGFTFAGGKPEVSDLGTCTVVAEEGTRKFLSR